MLNERLMAMKRYKICSFPLAMLEVISLITSSGDVAFPSQDFLTPSHSTKSGLDNVKYCDHHHLQALEKFASLFSISL